jgi:hypothetical protein
MRLLSEHELVPSVDVLTRPIGPFAYLHRIDLPSWTLR